MVCRHHPLTHNNMKEEVKKTAEEVKDKAEKQANKVEKKVEKAADDIAKKADDEEKIRVSNGESQMERTKWSLIHHRIAHHWE